MNKKSFIEAEIEVINFDEDVIATSSGIGGGGNDNPGGNKLVENTGFNGLEIPVSVPVPIYS